MTLATAAVTSTASPDAFFARWADMATWPEWNTDTEWVRLDGPFQAGTGGTLKPKGGPRVPFVIERLEPGRRFVDVSRLIGARLTFDHRVRSEPDGRTRVEVTVQLTGPLRLLWKTLLGKGIAASVQPDLDRLARAAEAAAESA
jgi:Polyketide cyclase / dehydrase and lipid transport